MACIYQLKGRDWQSGWKNKAPTSVTYKNLKKSNDTKMLKGKWWVKINQGKTSEKKPELAILFQIKKISEQGILWSTKRLFHNMESVLQESIANMNGYALNWRLQNI